MTAEERTSILSIALQAAYADGLKHAREREQIRRIALSLAKEAGAAELAPSYLDVLLDRARLEACAAALPDLAMRQLAYEMAVCVCDADGGQSDAERRFLAELHALLRLDRASTAAFEQEADAIARLTESAPLVVGNGDPAASLDPVATPHSQARDAELDKSILNYALINGALELLPQSWASLAIIPLQVRMVFGIGRAYGVELDQGHIKEFIATAGVGLTSQYLEQFARRLFGGLIGKVAGRAAGRLGSGAAGMATSFATTYALGQLAKRYYSGGRTMSQDLLRETLQSLLGPARQLQSRYLPHIRQQAETLDMGRVIAMVRGA